ncbi:MAG: hypothetical protein R2760_08050 [Chitinophagales bacterium]
MKNTYNTIHKRYNTQLHKLKRTDNLIRFLRMLIFLYLLGFSVFLYKSNQFNFLLINFFICIAIFLFLVSRNQDIINKIEYFKRILSTVDTELKKLDNNFDYSTINAERFADNEHLYTSDLDIFETNGLFSRINRAKTQSGKALLANRLKQLCTDSTELKERQEAIQELSGNKIEWSICFIASINEEIISSSEIAESNFWKNILYYKHISKITLRVLAIFNLSGIVLVANKMLPNYIALLLILFNIILHYSFFRKRKEIAIKIIAFKNYFERYLEMLKILDKETFNASKIKYLKNSIAQNETSFIAGFNNFSKTVNALESTIKNPFVGLLNTLFYTDIWYLKTIEKWNKEHKNSLIKSVQIINEIEVLISYALFYNINKHYTFPIFIEDNIFKLEAKNLGHPLLLSDKCVTNNLSISENNLFIITGANMAGKSTFLRTVGINIVLALNGLPVFADAFIIKPTLLFTSMRATDSLDKSNSYFLSEVKRLQKLIEELNQGRKYFIILDEILMGTNSDDKLLGSTLFTEKIISYKKVTGLLATHDIPLTKLQEKYPEIISNYKFEAEILSDKNIIYDYKLKKGVVTKMNAIHLMKTLDII